MTKKTFPVAYIEWDDSESIYGWREVEEGMPERIKSVGVVMKKDKKGVTISTSRTAYGKCVDQLWIPSTAIRKFRRIKIKEAGYV